MAVRVKLFATTLRVEQQIHKTSAPGPAGFARKVPLRRRSLAQRRKGAKRYRVSKGLALRLCAFAREIFSWFRACLDAFEYFSCKAAPTSRMRNVNQIVNSLIEINDTTLRDRTQ